jgi:hypothetical protein
MFESLAKSACYRSDGTNLKLPLNQVCQQLEVNRLADSCRRSVSLRGGT